MRATRCELQSGLFVLRVCGRDAVGECSDCGLCFCSKHAAAAVKVPGLCLVCAEKRGLLHDHHDDHWRHHIRDRDRNRIDPWHWRDRDRRDRHRDRDDDRADEKGDAAAATAATAGAAAFTAEEEAQFEETQVAGPGDGLAEDPGADFDSGAELEGDDLSIFDS